MLAKRLLNSFRLGFLFIGRTRSRLPRSVQFNRGRIKLFYPDDDGGYLSDIINVWLDDEYGLLKVKKVPCTIVDVGANIGLFSLWAWNLFPEATIHSYEPNPKLFSSLSSNLRTTSVIIHKAGVGSKNHNAQMKEMSDSRLSTVDLDHSGNIKVVSLSSVLNDIGGTIDLLKMDCEGAEWDILKDVTAFKNIRSIRMEYHLIDSWRFDDLHLQLANLGFKLTHHYPNTGFGIAYFDKLYE